VRRSRQTPARDAIRLGDDDLSRIAERALRHEGPVARPSHGFHTWPASLHPDAARDLVAALSGASVLDPFCGGGTVLVEALRVGRRAVGRDLSAVAALVARARTCRDRAAIGDMRAASRRIAERARTAPEAPPEAIGRVLERWYEAHVLRELGALRAGIEEHRGPGTLLLWVVFSSIVVKASFRVSDTRAERVVRHRPPGITAVLFHKKARELARSLLALAEDVPEGTPEADVAVSDARVRSADPVDLILTSPPYPSTYDYLPMQHLRHVWLGLTEPEHLEIGPRRAWRAGARDARRAWLGDTVAWMGAATDALRPGGHLAVVIGDGLAPAAVIDASEPTALAADRAGLRLVARASVVRPDTARETERWEHAMIFARSASRGL
jgi:SAM-dependent methyltransferase